MQPVSLVLVEDVPSEAEIAIRQLQTAGFSCTWRRVDSEAVLRRTLTEFKPDLILSDFTLPGFDGLSALDVARELASETPFIFLSGTLGEERAIDALQRGACDYVLKTNLARLAPAVRRALNEAGIRRARNRLEQRLRDIVVTSQDWIWEHDRDGRFTFCSDSVRAIQGMRPRKCSARTPRIHSPRRPGGARLRHTHTGAGTARRDQSAGTLASCNGSYRWLERSACCCCSVSKGRLWAIAAANETSRIGAARKTHQPSDPRAQDALRRQWRDGANSSASRNPDRGPAGSPPRWAAMPAAMVALIEPGTRTARPTAWSGSIDHAAAISPWHRDSREDMASSAACCAPVFFHGQQRSADARDAARGAALLDSGFRSVVALPLLVDRTGGRVNCSPRSTVGAVADEELPCCASWWPIFPLACSTCTRKTRSVSCHCFDPLTGLAKRTSASAWCAALEPPDPVGVAPRRWRCST
jgi:PAS domain S-box-containing protein